MWILVQGCLDHIDGHYRAVQRNVNAAGKHRIHEGVGIADQHVAIAHHHVRSVGIIAGGLSGHGHPGILHPCGQFRTELDGVPQERIQIAAAPLEVVRPTHRADAHLAVAERDKPEPAVLKPGDADIAFVLPFQPLTTFEMTEYGGAGVFRVALLGAQFPSHEGVPPAGVHHETGLPNPHIPLAVFRCHPARTRGIGINLDHPGALVNVHALGRGVIQQDLVQFGPPHLIRAGVRLVQGLRKVESRGVIVLRRNKLGAQLLDADGPHLIRNAQPLEDRQTERQQGLPDVKAREHILLQQRDPAALFRQQCRYRRSRRSAPNNQHVTSIVFFAHAL